MKRVQLEVASLYCYLLNILFDEKQELSVLLQATEDARKTCGMLNDRSTLKKLFERMERGKEYKRRLSSYFRGINEGDAYDYANTYHAQWQWPIEDTADRTESYMDLFELAVEQSKHLLMNQKRSYDIMKRIPSFCVDHTKLQPGIYTSRIDDDIVTYDIRMKKPNVPPFLPTASMHTIEHLFATISRNSNMSTKLFILVLWDAEPVFYFFGKRHETGRRHCFNSKNHDRYCQL